MLPNYNNHWQEARHRNTNRQPNQYHVPYNGPVFHRPLPPTNRRPPTNPSSYIPPHRRPTYNTYQSRGNHRPDQQQKRLPAHRRQPVPTHKEEEPFVKAFFQVLQCLHHLAIFTLQQQGQPAFTFKRKVSELDSFIRPAMKTSAVDANIRSLNRTWLSKVTQVLIDHYQTTLQEKLTTIRTKSLSSPAVDRIVSHALSWARRSYGKRLAQAVITKFYQTINETKTRVTISLPPEMDTTSAPSIGSSNLNRITKTSSDTEIHSYPGSQIHHIRSILESYDHDPKPTTIILHGWYYLYHYDKEMIEEEWYETTRMVPKHTEKENVEKVYSHTHPFIRYFIRQSIKGGRVSANRKSFETNKNG
ncbi:hypothetical protein LOTGIDRAFT_158387 [Lottia gigantea]|uniref:Uncharacterized protein n=1 Tax=Lottia gigantea TaxID=225164 RepID=V4AQ06_LOTGI|nr:hypothetical protein LOTGIDRAFT_158387 [Lottia gigantea]ESO99307.1 hypothetical protein LOTGIDRAFT_158387 [Lottia gigantea]